MAAPDGLEAVPAQRTGAWGDQAELDAAIESRTITSVHIKAVAVAGVGFFSDAYDLFIIGLAKPAIGIAYYNKPKLPHGVDLAISGAALVGTLCGQIFFGALGDKFGRKSVYLFTLLILITATIGQCTSASAVRGASFAVWLAMWRFILGFGVGGEYPLSAAIASEWSSRHNRGALVASVFAMQGFGILTASIVALCVAAAMKSAIIADVLNLDYAWRIMLGMGVIPALATMYLREQMPETPAYRQEQAIKKAEAEAAAGAREAGGKAANGSNIIPAAALNAAPAGGGGAKTLKEYLSYPTLMQNRNAWILLGTCMTWLLLDIAFYSQNLFLPDLLRTTGFSSFPTIPKGGSAACTGECAELVWRGVFRSAVGNAVVALIGTVPGYWFTVFFVDKWGRVPIQFMGFGMMTTMLVILACVYEKLVPPPGSPTIVSPWIFLALYSTTFFFANFGPNSTTFIVPAEVFHTRFRGTLHGVSAAMGKLGAIIGVFGFGELQLSRGTRPTLIALAVVNFVGMLFTFFIPETRTMELHDASTRSLSTWGRVVQKEPVCPLAGPTNADSHNGAMLQKGE